jgi:DNA repair exonuclease SbcCD ATPase subunit
MKTTIDKIVRFLEKYPQYKNQIKIKNRFGYDYIEDAFLSAKNSKIIRVETDCGKIIETSPDHLLLSNDIKWQLVKKLKIGDFLFTEDGATKVKSLNKLRLREDLFDLRVNKNSEFFANGIVSHNSSGILDSISYVLYGKGYRKSTKPKLINDKNGKDCLVEIRFRINSDSYFIRRGMAPNIFEIYKNDILLNQDAATKDYQQHLEQNILKMNHITFCNLICIGKQSFSSFFEFDTNKRRKFIEELLSLNIFTTMNELNKFKISKLKQELEKLKTEIKITKSKLDYTASYIKKIQTEEANKKESVRQEIESELFNLNSSMNKIDLALAEHDKNLQSINVDTSQLDSITKKIDSFNQVIIKADLRISQLNNTIDKINSEDDCQSCGQFIPPELKLSNIEKNSKLLNEILKLKSDAELKLNDNIWKRDGIIRDVNDVTTIETEKTQLYKDKDSITKQINLLNSKLNVQEVNSSIETEKETARILLNEYQSLLNQKESLLTDLERHDFISTLLCDSGIKGSIIKQYLPVLIDNMNKNLLAFGFNVRVDFDDQFNETFYYNGFTQRDYTNFSSGEKIRIDVSLLLTFRMIAKLQKNLDSNLLIIDEILDGSLDTSGLEAFIEILNEQDNLNLFIISHNKEKYGSTFDNEMSFVKINGFSTIEEK